MSTLVFLATIALSAVVMFLCHSWAVRAQFRADQRSNNPMHRIHAPALAAVRMVTTYLLTGSIVVLGVLVVLGLPLVAYAVLGFGALGAAGAWEAHRTAQIRKS